MNRKISLMASVLLVLTLSMFARPAAAYLLPSVWNATGTALVYKNGILKYGPAEIFVNQTLHVVIGPHYDTYNNTLWLWVPTSSPNWWGFLWTIVQTTVLPNGNIVFYAVPLTINTYGIILPVIVQAGPSPITVVVSSLITAPGSVHYGHSWIQVTPEHALSLNVAYFYGWNTPNI